MKFHYTTNFYDYNLAGTCIYNNKIALYYSVDETDYDTMTNTCLCCKNGGTENYKDCHCQNAPIVYCYVTELSFLKRIYKRVQIYYYALRFIKNHGWYGIKYWRNWT